MSNQKSNQNEIDPKDIPAGQKLLDRPFLLLFLGIIVMLVFYTGWGMVEIMSLPEATLP